MMNKPPAPEQKGSFVLGMVVGLLLGLAVALGVALYVAKVPMPFIDKVPQRSSQADEAEAKSLKDWNPNAKLPGVGKPVAPVASGVVLAPAGGAASEVGQSAAPAVAASSATPASVPGSSPTPAATKASAAKASEAGFVFFVQAGAFTQAADAEQQRAKLAMQGFNAKVYERANGERSVFRVRIGPFDQRADAEALMTQVQGAGLEAALVRTQR